MGVDAEKASTDASHQHWVRGGPAPAIAEMTQRFNRTTLGVQHRILLPRRVSAVCFRVRVCLHTCVCTHMCVCVCGGGGMDERTASASCRQKSGPP